MVEQQIANQSDLLKIPDDTDTVYADQFARKNYKRVFVPKSVVEIQKSAFSDWTDLEEVTFEDGSMLKTIGQEAFYGCTDLKNITFPDSLETIGLGAFWESGLERVTLPSSLRVLAQAAFAECKNLKTAVLNEGLETLGTDDYDEDGDMTFGVFDQSALENVRLPSTLKRIEYSAFDECKQLKSIQLPEGLKYIGR